MSHSIPQSRTTRLEFKHNGCTTRITLDVVHDSDEFPPEILPDEPSGMTLAGTIPEMREGRVVRRSGWSPKKTIGLASDGDWFYRQDGKRYILTAEDILAADWKIA